MRRKIPPEDYFTFFHVDRVPPEAFIGTKPDPIYDPISESGWVACMDFYRRAEVFLRNECTTPPDLEDVLKVGIPHGPILRIELGQDQKFGVKAGIQFSDLDRLEERDQRSLRNFDPEYVPVMLMLIAAGSSIRINDTKRKQDKLGNALPKTQRKLFATFGRGASANISLLAIIRDAKTGEQVQRIHRKSDPNFFYEHRRAALEVKIRSSGRGNRKANVRGREGAIRLAAKHWERAMHSQKCMPTPIDASEYAELLRWAFDVADELYRYNHRAD